MKYLVEEYAHGFSRKVGETEVGWLAMLAARENAADRRIETRVYSEDGRTAYAFAAGGREMIPIIEDDKRCDDDLWASHEKGDLSLG